LLDGCILWNGPGEGKAGVMKILLVEDSKFLRVATERALTTAGYEGISADNGEQAFEAGTRACA